MIQTNQKKIGDKKIKNKAGGLANESRLISTVRELRQHKVIIVPSVNTNDIVKMEQGWNKKAREKDVIRLTIKNKSTIITREELEQAIASLSQGNEVIKWQAPKTN